MQEVRGFIDFEKTSPSYLWSLFFPDYDINKVLKTNSDRVSKSMQSSGIKSGNLFQNLFPLLTVAILGLIFFAILYLIQRFGCEKIKDKAKAKYDELKEEMIWNGFYTSFNLSFMILVSAIAALTIELQMTKSKDSNLFNKIAVPFLWTVMVLFTLRLYSFVKCWKL